MPNDEGAQRVSREGSQLRRVCDKRLLTDRDIARANPLVILLHGFTRHGDNLHKLGFHLEQRQWQGANLLAVTYSYPSHQGIDLAARTLKDRLQRYNKRTGGVLRSKGVYLVAHSMGGLVARSFALDAELGGCVRGIVMLGTPNMGAFGDKKWVSFAIALAESMSGVPMPELQKAACVAIKQLTRTDKSAGPPYIDSLNNAWKNAFDRPPTLTISGGMPQLDLYSNQRKNMYANMSLQLAIGCKPNDGLIAEKSVNVCPSIFLKPPNEYRHYNSYPEYTIINHSNLINNETVGDEIVAWIEAVHNCAQPRTPSEVP